MTEQHVRVGESRISRSQVGLFAVSAGISVANIYYVQPLLTVIARDFHVGAGSVSQLVTLTTTGYAAGLILVVPLADMVDRRRLITCLCCAVAILQALSAVAPSIPALVLLSTLMAASSVVAPIMVAFAATLAAPEQRGRVTGSVMGGVLIGLLVARTGGGLIAQWAGTWRATYAVAAVIMAVLAVVLCRGLPAVPVAERIGYGSLLRSVGSIIASEPALRLRCVYGMLCFAGFSAFWATAAFRLSERPYDFGSGLIGVFGLVGVVGAMAARAVGWFVDRGWSDGITGAMLAVVLASWVCIACAGGGWLGTLVLGIVLLDLGVQGVQVANLGAIYRLRPEARGRITMAYTGTYFIGGAVGAAAAGAAFAARGWNAVCIVGGGLAVVGIAIWLALRIGALRTFGPLPPK